MPIVRCLADDEPSPDEPGRRITGSEGYMLLIWTVGPSSYVTRREHREVMMRLGHDLRGRQVHHINGVRSDNRPENLEVATPAQHGIEHRRFDHDLIVRLSETGLTALEIAQKVGCSREMVYRVVRLTSSPPCA